MDRGPKATPAVGSGPRNSGPKLSRSLFNKGLRVSELAGLRLGDVIVETNRPRIVVRAEIAKGGKPRYVPLWWDAGTLADLVEWKKARRDAGARDGDVYMVSRSQAVPQSRHTLRRRFRTACKALGLTRLASLTIHHGRHMFISHALAGGRTLAELKAAAGHANLVTTSTYLHIAVDDDGKVGELFAAR